MNKTDIIAIITIVAVLVVLYLIFDYEIKGFFFNQKWYRRFKGGTWYYVEDRQATRVLGYPLYYWINEEPSSYHNIFKTEKYG